MSNPFSKWEINSLDVQLIQLAFMEDLGPESIDPTSQILFADHGKIYTAKIVNKHSEPIILCGLKIIEMILDREKTPYELQTHFTDGQRIEPGETLFTLTAPANHLLKIERILLNFLQHLCAIATETKRFVSRIQTTATKILDTRKTLPGFRHLDKYAVYCGGGVNHRMGLYDAIMIKDNHVDFLGGMDEALKKLPANIKEKYPVIVEIRTIAELKMILTTGLSKISRVLLDNMSVDQLTECVKLCDSKIATEASGNIHLENVLAVAKTGVNFISVGKITHSPTHVDLSMKSEKKNAK